MGIGSQEALYSELDTNTMETTVTRSMVLLGWVSVWSVALAAVPAAAQTRRATRCEAPTWGTLIKTSSDAPAILWHDDLESGWRESRRRDLPMVIFITSENCTYCDAMKRETWGNPSVRERIANGFVAIRLTPRKNAATLKRIDIKMFPMTLIGEPRGKVIGHRMGYQPPAALHQLLSEAKGRPRLVR